MSDTIKLTFTREDCDKIVEATHDPMLGSILGASNSPVFDMFDWLNRNTKGRTYDSKGCIEVTVPERLGVDYLASLLIMNKIAPKWNFRRMAFRASGFFALFVEGSLANILEKMDKMNEEGNDDAHRWN